MILGSAIQLAKTQADAVMRAAGLEPEPPGVIEAIEAHRERWRPDRIRLLLIAESHIAGDATDLALPVRRNLLPIEARDTPEGLTRHVYCLAYGEPSLLDGRPLRPNAGTPQFWAIVSRLAGTGTPPTVRGTDLATRLAWKIATLERLRQDGIWLVDAAAQAIYAPGGRRLPAPIARAIHRGWWHHIGQPLVASLPGVRLFAVGKLVRDALLACGAPIDPDDWIYQPQAKRHGRRIDMNRGWDRLLPSGRHLRDSGRDTRINCSSALPW